MEESNEEISIDFKKIGDFFRKIKKNIKHPENRVDEGQDKDSFQTIDITKIFHLVKKHQIIFILVLLIILQFMPNAGFFPWGGLWMRMQSQNLPQIDNWAADSVHNFYKNQISEQINRQYPNLPEENKNKLVDKELNKILSEQKETVDAQIKEMAKQFRSRFQYESNGKSYVYMPDIDPYTYLRFARNKIETGSFADTIKDGTTWDDHSLAPLGRRVSINFHHFFLVFLYKIMSFFNSNIPLMQSATYFPIIMIFLSLFPIFFIGKRLAGNVGGFFAASMMVLNVGALGRTPWGHADTDAYNIFFPILIVWLFIESIIAKSYKKKLLFSALTAFSLAIFSKAWAGGWWYVFYFLLITLFINLAYLIIFNYTEIIKKPSFLKESRELKNIFLIACTFFIFSGIFISIFSSVDSFTNIILAPFTFTVIKAASHANLWPNVYTTVAELNPASISSIIDGIGGKFLFLISSIGILLTLTIKDSSGKRRDIKYAVLLIVWFASTIYASTKGVRFVLLLVPAFSIAFGVAAGMIHIWVSKWMKKELKIPKWVSGIVIITIFGILLISPTKSSYASINNNFPIINDAWWNSLTKIKEESAPNAIINSWWDFGHHFKYIADRAVTFDGATQNYPHAHWIGKALLTDNEDVAVGILRMLDCGSNNAFELINEKLQDTAKSVDLIYTIITVGKEEAKDILTEYFDDPEEILQYTHCSPPENYFITSADMINKAGVWAHFGGWDFKRADVWVNLRRLDRTEAVQTMVEKYNFSEEQAENIYFEAQAITDEKEANAWISPWPGFASSISGCAESNNIIKCSNGLIVKKNNSEYTALINIQNRAGVPKSLVYIDKESKKVIEKEFDNTEVEISAVLIPEGSGYSSILVSKELAMSMFTRLFFLKGHGLKHFDLFDEQRQVTGGMIYVWKADWEGHKPNIHPDLIEKTIVSKGDIVVVEYIGWLENGTVFDSSINDWNSKNISKNADFDEYENTPLQFKVGEGKMIKGFDEGVKGMQKGSVKTTKIAPEDAYGINAKKHPLGNQTLNFKIKIIEID
ncbi:FKBP-type peptidyl-prolyl cis-trans isomerase [Candidatus Woesearchaeota archaeon]|nr:FKBP-type peptidyl-prolyl cis-trans isomerase [Candidatus Woesearchaeota archaeon]